MDGIFDSDLQRLRQKSSRRRKPPIEPVKRTCSPSQNLLVQAKNIDTLDCPNSQQLNQILLDSMPCVAMLLKAGSYEIIASNQKAREVGTIPGTTCYAGWWKFSEPCPWCHGPEAIEKQQIVKKENEHNGRIWESYWIPVSKDHYLHFAFDVTDTRQVQKALQESEERFRAIANYTVDWESWFGPDGTYLWVNPAVERITGYSAEETMAMSDFISSLIAPEDQSRFRDHFRNFIGGSRGENLEFQVIHKDGSKRSILASWQSIYAVNGQFLGTRFSGRDITDRKRIENIMQARFRLLGFERTHSTDEFLTATLDEMEALTGSKIGFYHFVDPDQNTLSLQSWSTNTLKNMCTAEGKGSHYDIAQAGVWVDCVYQRRPVIHNDYPSLTHRKGIPQGHAPVTREVVIPIFRGDQIKAIIGVGNKASDYTETDIEIVSQLGDLSWDIIERKMAEESLLLSKNLIRSIVDAAPVAIIGLDLEGKVHTIWNRMAEKMLGWTAEEAMGRLLPSVPVTCEKEFERFREIIRSGKSLEGIDVRRQKRDGSPIDYSIYASPIHDAQGEITGNIAVLVDITDRKRTEDRLRENEERYQAVVRTSMDGFWVVDMEGRLLEVNDAYCVMSGYSREALLSMRITDLECIESPVQIHAHIERILAQGHDRFESRHRRADGAVLDIQISTILHPSRNLILSFISNITDWKQAENALRESEQRYRMAQSIAHVGNWEYNLRTGQFWGSDEAKRIYGFGPEQGIFSTDEVENCIPERERVHQALVDLIETGKPYNLEFEIHPGHSSQSRIITSIAELQRDEHGNPLRIVGVIQDITERKRAEENIALLSFALNNVHEAAFLIDENAGLQFVNEESCRSLGYTREELLKLGVSEVDPDFPAKRWPDHWDTLKTRHSLCFESRHKTKDGRLFPVEVNANYIEFGGKVYNLALVRDITERWKAQNKLLEYQRKLRSLISQITMAEEQERKRIATELHDRLGQSMVFTKMKLDVLDFSKFPSSACQVLRQTSDAIGTLIHTTQSITYDLSYPVLYERGLIVAIKEWINEEFTPKYAIPVFVQIHTEINDLASEQRVFTFRAVRELLINIAKHSKAKSATVMISSRTDWFQIEVRDTGIGFDIERLRKESKKHFGLFSIRERLEYLGGKMNIHSRPGEGTSVLLELPLAR